MGGEGGGGGGHKRCNLPHFSQPLALGAGHEWCNQPLRPILPVMTVVNLFTYLQCINIIIAKKTAPKIVSGTKIVAGLMFLYCRITT